MPCPVLQTDYIFATVPNLQKDSANVSNGADGSAGNSGISWMVMFCRISVWFFRSFVSAVATAGEHESNGQVTQGIVTSLLAFCNALSLLRYFLRYSVGRYFVTQKFGLVWFGFLTAHQHKKAISARSTIKLWLLYLKSNYFVLCINSKTYNNEKSEKPLVASYDRQVLAEAVFY